MTPAVLKNLMVSVESVAKATPIAILARETPIYEVDITGLLFEEETRLQSCDLAVLALARALGAIVPADVDAYLGLGEIVSQAVMYRLLEDNLVEQCDEASDSVLTRNQHGFMQRLISRIANLPAVHRADITLPTQASKLRNSTAPTHPIFRLTAAGAQALDRGVVTHRRARPARLRFTADPLLFLDLDDERTYTHSQHVRPAPLPPERVPLSLQKLDDALGLIPAERMAACGIGAQVPGMRGQLIGILTGSQWEVRQALAPRNPAKTVTPSHAQIIFAAFPVEPRGSLHWQSFRVNRTISYCKNLDPSRLLPAESRQLEGLLDAIAGPTALPKACDLRPDGAITFRCDAATLPTTLGDTDRPDDAVLAICKGDWWAAVRVHGLPADIEAGRATYFEFLRRRDMELRENFDDACRGVATDLIRYWDENPGLPSIEESAIRLWDQPDMRAALCNRRMRDDMISPYTNQDRMTERGKK